MLRSIACLFVLAAGNCGTAIASDDAPPVKTAEPTTAAESRSDVGRPELLNTPAAMTARVDELLAKYWQAHNITPAEPSSDAEFMRRAYLDLIGTLPYPTEVEDFLADKSIAKRAELVDRLVNRPLHPTHLAHTWRRILIPEGASGNPLGTIGMQDWLREQFANNTRFDRLVGNFLTVTGSQDMGPVLFYQLLELKPEKLAASTARCFLGLQLQCAQCHDHPFVETSQEDFWSYAAFFAQVRNRYGENMTPFGQFALYDTGKGEVSLPDSEDEIAPRYPGSQQSADQRGTRREQLSLWMSSPDNPFLGPATVNRVWNLLFGRGLVMPVDDMGPHNPSDHPELLDELSAYFVASGYDLRQLFQVLSKSSAYQLSSTTNSDQTIPDSSFAQMHVKTLTADQLYDALRATLRMPKSAPTLNALADPQRQEFMAQMESQSSELSRFESSVQQTLMMMNGKITERFINGQQEGLTAALAAPFLDNEQRLEILFLGSLTREPTAAERTTFLAHLADQNDPAAIQDILWSLVNCAEYRLNH